jgi:hypothetical protein
VTGRWYHGGYPGLRRGGKILPPSVTGSHSIADTAEHHDDLRDRVQAVHSRDRVYIASDLHVARLWASLHPAYGGKTRGGDVYEVVPDGPLEPDPDYLPGDGGSMACASATIVRVIGRRVPRPSPEQIAILAGGRL